MKDYIAIKILSYFPKCAFFVTAKTRIIAMALRKGEGYFSSFASRSTFCVFLERILIALFSVSFLLEKLGI